MHRRWHAKVQAREKVSKAFHVNRLLLFAGLLGALITAQAGWREQTSGVESRPGVRQPFVLSVGEGVEVKNIVLFITGGAGTIKRARDGELVEKVVGFSVRGFLAERTGASAMLGIPLGAEAITIEDRESIEHVKDIDAVANTLKARWPNARVFIVGLSNGALSAAHAGAVLGDKLAGVVLMSANPQAFREEWMDAIKAPVLVVHHKRDSCMPYRDIEAKAAWYTFLTVDDIDKPLPGTVHDCGPASAHVFAGKYVTVFRAVADWINTGRVGDNYASVTLHSPVPQPLARWDRETLLPPSVRSLGWGVRMVNWLQATQFEK
jgi:predicted esterase